MTATRPPSQRLHTRAAPVFRRHPELSRVAVLIALLLSTLYFLAPIWWLLVAATKPAGRQFERAGFWFDGFGLIDNVSDLIAFATASTSACFSTR